MEKFVKSDPQWCKSMFDCGVGNVLMLSIDILVDCDVEFFNKEKVSELKKMPVNLEKGEYEEESDNSETEKNNFLASLSPRSSTVLGLGSSDFSTMDVLSTFTAQSSSQTNYIYLRKNVSLNPIPRFISPFFTSHKINENNVIASNPAFPQTPLMCALLYLEIILFTMYGRSSSKSLCIETRNKIDEISGFNKIKEWRQWSVDIVGEPGSVKPGQSKYGLDADLLVYYVEVRNRIAHIMIMILSRDDSEEAISHYYSLLSTVLSMMVVGTSSHSLKPVNSKSVNSNSSSEHSFLPLSSVKDVVSFLFLSLCPIHSNSSIHGKSNWRYFSNVVTAYVSTFQYPLMAAVSAIRYLSQATKFCKWLFNENVLKLLQKTINNPVIYVSNISIAAFRNIWVSQNKKLVRSSIISSDIIDDVKKMMNERLICLENNDYFRKLACRTVTSQQTGFHFYEIPRSDIIEVDLEKKKPDIESLIVVQPYIRMLENLFDIIFETTVNRVFIIYK
jgi:hypothetical protein